MTVPNGTRGNGTDGQPADRHADGERETPAGEAAGRSADPESRAGDLPGEAQADATRPGAHGGLDLDEAVREVEALEHEYRPPAAGAPSNVLTAAVVVVLGVAALVGASSLGSGSARQPGPGMWPMAISVALVVLGIVLLLGARRSSDAEKFSGASLLVLAGLATMVVFVAVIEVVGFELPAGLLCFVWLRFLGREGWRMSIVTSVGVVVGFYLVFVAALGVPIPHLF